MILLVFRFSYTFLYFELFYELSMTSAFLTCAYAHSRYEDMVHDYDITKDSNAIMKQKLANLKADKDTLLRADGRFVKFKSQIDEVVVPGIEKQLNELMTASTD